MYLSYLYNLYVQKFVYISDLTLIMYNSDTCHRVSGLCWSGYPAMQTFFYFWQAFSSFKNTWYCIQTVIGKVYDTWYLILH